MDEIFGTHKTLGPPLISREPGGLYTGDGGHRIQEQAVRCTAASAEPVTWMWGEGEPGR